jgi:hypothetical protein
MVDLLLVTRLLTSWATTAPCAAFFKMAARREWGACTIAPRVEELTQCGRQLCFTCLFLSRRRLVLEFLKGLDELKQGVEAGPDAPRWARASQIDVLARFALAISSR